MRLVPGEITSIREIAKTNNSRKHKLMPNMKTLSELTRRPKHTLTNIIHASIAEFYYEWGNEPIGHVSFGRYVDDVFQFVGVGPRAWVKPLGLQFKNPHA